MAPLCRILASSIAQDDVEVAATQPHAYANMEFAMAGRHGRWPSAFSASAPDTDAALPGSEVMCGEGFRCVSLTAKFGRNHTLGGELGMGSVSDKLEDPANKSTYEWNCPHKGKWAANKFSVGSGEDECAEDSKDCLCITRSSNSMSSIVTDGREVISGIFGVDKKGTLTPEEATRESLTVIPHYNMRQLSDTFSPRQPHSDMGAVAGVPQADYVANYHEHAEKVQDALDKLHKDITRVFENRLEDRTLACGTASEGGSVDAGLHGGKLSVFSPAEVQEVLTKIRRLQILTQDCEMLKENIAKVAPSLQTEQFNKTLVSSALNCDCSSLGCLL
eukprot:TRINITY_DN47965_c0_g1_i3.p1 TRINITY_DN47965_c0_g1~~TRINITY_DN47965_c0_g1_i3.p1  ORF type:complete len:333 (-),score=45.61 TRINITY_DN47965_c0_g1_i3:109-1107(-)